MSTLRWRCMHATGNKTNVHGSGIEVACRDVELDVQDATLKGIKRIVGKSSKGFSTHASKNTFLVLAMKEDSGASSNLGKIPGVLKVTRSVSQQVRRARSLWLLTLSIHIPSSPSPPPSPSPSPSNRYPTSSWRCLCADPPLSNSAPDPIFAPRTRHLSPNILHTLHAVYTIFEILWGNRRPRTSSCMLATSASPTLDREPLTMYRDRLLGTNCRGG
jgi:hypothetical protein